MTNYCTSDCIFFAEEDAAILDFEVRFEMCEVKITVFKRFTIAVLSIYS